MNKKQKEVVKELNESAKQLGYSPRRREISHGLLWKCYKYFSSFNQAKKIAGLEISHIRITQFPKNAFKIDKDLGRIASYLTFDGHIYKDSKSIFYSSKNISDIKDFENIILRKFSMNGKCKLNSAGSENQTHQFYVFNKRIATELFNLGIPKGDKVTQEFNVPRWIKDSKELAREYLKIAFLCEGSMKENRRNPRIQINTAKTEDFIPSGIAFMNELREMLLKFGIRTTECSLF